MASAGSDFMDGHRQINELAATERLIGCHPDWP
jgi:hypothetical protein